MTPFGRSKHVTTTNRTPQEVSLWEQVLSHEDSRALVDTFSFLEGHVVDLPGVVAEVLVPLGRARGSVTLLRVSTHAYTGFLG